MSIKEGYDNCPEHILLYCYATVKVHAVQCDAILSYPLVLRCKR